MCKKFRQKQRIDYDEIFALMIRVTIIKMLLALTVKYDYEVEQMNVVTAFLEAQGNLSKHMIYQIDRQVIEHNRTIKPSPYST